VLDLKLPDMSGMEVMQHMSEDPALSDIPVVVFTGRELTPAQESQLQDLARTVVLKGVESPERLLDETALFLHRDITHLPQPKQRLLERLRQSNASLMGRKVLVVDDDVRNIFALGNLLERHGMQVVTAQTGPEAIAALQASSDIAVVLMDIMMPGMDGYETMRLIRQSPGMRRLPIVAVTAKAMKGDREKCLEAGASDYLAKPVDTDQLLAMLRLWLHR
jgi:CheY-like chemotaxis protein